MPPDNHVTALEERLNLTHQGTVIQWVQEHMVNRRRPNMGGKGNQFSKQFKYAAIKIQGKWYTTATENNPSVESVMSNAELAALIILEAVPNTLLEATDWGSFP